MSTTIPRFALRSSESGRRLDLFLVCAVGSVIGNRVFLIITGYPQLGNGTLHISHAIWGALMMVIAIVFSISFLAPNNRTFIAFIGGCGFGWFIDELGKFITRDVNYFFQPTIALIYIVFIAMYLVFRSIERREYTADEAVLNGLEALKSAAIGELSEPRRVAAMALLDQTGADDAVAVHVRAVLGDVTGLPAARPNRFERAGRSIRRWYLGLSVRRWFTRIVTWWFVVVGSLQFVAAVVLSLDHRGIRGFEEWAIVISSGVSGALIIVGVVRLRHHRIEAYRWFERGILVQIFVTQVFEFAQEQVSGIFGLAFNLLVWISLRLMIRAELERQLVEADAVASLDSSE
ncbi:MAG TPA: hypothetical protein VFW97_15160 [Acidimicrobiia bacterium]|nr:hypothetical protein [Acidimicrobiia bacterium]